jgi:hypothetical protein
VSFLKICWISGLRFWIVYYRVAGVRGKSKFKQPKQVESVRTKKARLSAEPNPPNPLARTCLIPNNDTKNKTNAPRANVSSPFRNRVHHAHTQASAFLPFWNDCFSQMMTVPHQWNVLAHGRRSKNTTVKTAKRVLRLSGYLLATLLSFWGIPLWMRPPWVPLRPFKAPDTTKTNV